MPFPVTDRVGISRDRTGTHIEHLQQPFVAADSADGLDEAVRADLSAEASSPRQLADEYLKRVAPLLNLDESLLPTAADATAEAAPDRLEPAEEKELMGTTTVSYQQTHEGLPVWEAGVNVTVLPEPLRVTASQSSVHRDIGPIATDNVNATEVTPEALAKALGLHSAEDVEVTSERRLIYRLDPDLRFDPELKIEHEVALQEPPPTLPLPPLPPELQPGQHYVVNEVLFTHPIERFGPVHWRAFVEETTGAVVYLRAFTACVTGLIFPRDPSTAGGSRGCNAYGARRNPQPVPHLGRACGAFGCQPAEPGRSVRGGCQQRSAGDSAADRRRTRQLRL